jgi:HlyD family secretion protein
VFAIDRDRARVRDVQIGHRGPLSTEVTAGLSPGDEVIVHPGGSVRDGIAVEHR